jgi:hypothetical protein
MRIQDDATKTFREESYMGGTKCKLTLPGHWQKSNHATINISLYKQ